MEAAVIAFELQLRIDGGVWPLQRDTLCSLINVVAIEINVSAHMWFSLEVKVGKCADDISLQINVKTNPNPMV